MKYTLGAIALALISPAVFAQSSVTIYGIIDVNGQYQSGHAKDVVINSGGLNGSRLGFKGTEDIGGGNFVDFVLEGGLNVDSGTSGQGGSLFGRQAFGDIRTPYGTLSAGRQYSSLYPISADFSAFSNNVVGASTTVIGGFAGGYEPVRGGANVATPTAATGESVNGGPARVNNSVRYTTPSIAGFKISGLYGAGEVTGQTQADRLFDGSVRYTNYGLDAMVSVVDDKFRGASALTSTDVMTTTVAANYALGSAHIEGGFMNVNDKGILNQDGKGYWFGGDYRIGANLIRAQWVQNSPEHATTTLGKTNAYGVGYQYDFSKRTSLYTSLTRFENSGNFAGRNDGGVSMTTGLTTPTDNDVTEFALGVRHNF